MTFKWTSDTKELSVTEVKESQSIVSLKIHFQFVIQTVEIFKVMRSAISFEAIYSRMDQIKFAKESLLKI